VGGLAIGLLLYGSGAAGASLYLSEVGYMGGDFWIPTLSVFLCLPLFMLAVQTPLWLVRVWLGWRIIHSDDHPFPARRMKLAIRDLMIGTGLVALALALGRIAQSISATSGEQVLFALIIMALGAAVLSSLVTLPAVIATLRARRLLLGLAVFLAIQLGVAFVLAAIVGVTRASMFFALDMIVLFTSNAIVFVLFVCGVLVPARWLGYQLEWGWAERDKGDGPPESPFS
jgi:hypothetical protein